MDTKELDALLDDLDTWEALPVLTTGPLEPEGTDGDQDVLTEVVGFAKLDGDDDDKVRTAKAAIAWGRAQVEARVAIYKGLCLMFVRSCLGIDPLAPDAKGAWEISRSRRRCSPHDARRGHAGFFKGGEHWHVVLCLGKGRCFTNDTGAPGTVNVALITDIEKAWGYPFLGDTNDLNGESPAPAPRPRKRLTSREWRLRELRRLRAIARSNGNGPRAQRLTDWIGAMR